MIVQHLLVLLLAVGIPLWDWYEVPRLKASTDPRKKVKFYRRTVSLLWICALIAVISIGLLQVFFIHPSQAEVGWMERGSVGAIFVEGVAAGSLIAVFLPAVLARRSDKIREKTVKAAKKLAYLLPSSGEERRWWWLVCITAGVCEEAVYRGFLLHYFHTLPFHLTITLALGVSSVIFGMGHLYQGLAGALGATVLGFVFGCLFVATGSLLIPIVLHAVLDLRVLLMLPEGFDQAEA